MRLALAVLAAGTGCAQLFGIDETTGADANTDVATVQVQRVSIGASVVKTPQDLSAETAQFMQADGAFVPGVATGNTFVSELPGTPPALFTLMFDPLLPRRLWATPARVQRGNVFLYEHPGAMPAPATSKVALDITLPSPYVSGQSFGIQVIGAWTQKSLVAELPTVDTGATKIMPAAPIDYTTFTHFPNLGLSTTMPTRISSADQALVLRYTGQVLSGVFQTQFDQTDGTDSMAGPMTNIVAGSMLMATLAPMDFMSRFTAVNPRVTGLTMSWRLQAAPGWQVGDAQGVRLNNGAVAASDTMLTAMYSNPFESLDWKTVFSFQSSSPRTFSFTEGANTANVGLAARLETYQEPGTTALNLTMPAGLPTTIRADQTLLATDGMTLAIDPAKTITFDAIIDRATNTAYDLFVVQLGFDSAATPALTRKVVLHAVTTGEPTFKIPGSLFEAGKSYYITFRCFQGGYVNAATGDLQTFSFPYSVGSTDSAVFTVGMP